MWWFNWLCVAFVLCMCCVWVWVKWQWWTDGWEKEKEALVPAKCESCQSLKRSKRTLAQPIVSPLQSATARQPEQNMTWHERQSSFFNHDAGCWVYCAVWPHCLINFTTRLSEFWGVFLTLFEVWIIRRNSFRLLGYLWHIWTFRKSQILRNGGH